jgi:hypothetical protein
LMSKKMVENWWCMIEYEKAWSERRLHGTKSIHR